MFFTAFFPQFLNPAAPIVPQFAILALTFIALEFTVLTLCALGVARLLPVLRSSGPVRGPVTAVVRVRLGPGLRVVERRYRLRL